MTPKTTETRSAFPRWAIAVIAIVTLLGAGVRWRFLDHPMRYDESYNYLQYASKSPSYIVTHYVPNNHILHTLFVHFTSRLIGDHPAALRLPAFVFGVLLIPATAWLGWLLSRRLTVALAAALAVCGSSALVEYSANARGYSLLALLTVLTLAQAVRILEDPAKKGRWLALGAIAALGAYTVPVMVLPFAGLAAFMLVHEARTTRKLPGNAFWMVAVAGAGTAVLYAPIILFGGVTAVSGAGEMAYEVLGRQLHSTSDVFVGAWQFWCRGVGMAWQILIALGLIASLIRVARDRSGRAPLPLVVLAGAFLMAAVAQAPLPSRTWLFALPIILVLAASGLAEFGSAARASALRKAAVYAALAMLVAMPMTRTPFESRLCSEPGGLVESDPALAECQSFGIDRCAIVAPYSPATAYYMRQRGIPSLPSPDAPGVQRVVVVTTSNRKLSELWHSEMAGYNRFESPRVARIAPFGAVHLADRLDLAAATR